MTSTTKRKTSRKITALLHLHRDALRLVTLSHYRGTQNNTRVLFGCILKRYSTCAKLSKAAGCTVRAYTDQIFLFHLISTEAVYFLSSFKGKKRFKKNAYYWHGWMAKNIISTKTHVFGGATNARVVAFLIHD